MDRLRVVTWNIHSAVGLDGVSSVRRIADVLARLDADIVALQEVSAFSPLPSEARRLAGSLGMRYSFQANVRRLRYRFGNAVLTRGTIETVSHIPLPGPAEPRGVLVADISLGDRRIAFLATHLGLDAAERTEQKAAIAAVLPPDAPVVLAGDFNEPPDRLGALAERLTLAAPVPSYPAAGPTVAIDLVLTSGQWRAERVEAVPTDASDHLPVVADLVPASPASTRS